MLIGNFLSSSPGKRGVCEELAIRLSTSGWRVISASRQPRRILRLADMVSTTWHYRHLYDVAQIDLYSGQAFIWAEVVAWMLKQFKIPYILTLHGGNLPNFSRRWPARVRRLLRSAAVVTCPSPYLLKSMHAYRSELTLLPNPIELSDYPLRKRQTLEPQLIWLRAFHEIYNPMLAPRVLSLLKPHYPNAHLTMIGPDKGDGALQKTQQLAAELNVADAITFPGGVSKSDVPSWLDKGDIFLNTTNVDNTPISVLEAMASGLCVVSTDVGGLKYLLKNEVNAMLVPQNAPEKMALAVQHLLNDGQLASELQDSARRIVAHFDWSLILPQWEALLEASMEVGLSQISQEANR